MSGWQKTLCLLRRNSIQKIFRQRFIRAAAVSEASLRDVRPFEDIPGPTGVYNIPVIGAMFHFKPYTSYSLENLHMLYNSLLEKYGPLVRVRLGQWTVLVEDEVDMEKVMRNEGRHPDRPLPFIHVWYCEKYGMQKGIGTLNGTEWQKLRSAVNSPLLKPKSALRYLPIQNQIADELVACMKRKEKSPEEIQELFFRYACESISTVVFNDRLGYLNDDANNDQEKMQVLKDLQRIFEIINNSLTIPPFVLMNVPMKLKSEYKEAADNVIRYVEKYYRNVLKEIERRKDDKSFKIEDSFVYSMLAEKLTVEEMGTVALDLFGAGTDSTARTLQTFLHTIAKNPDKQEKLFEEIARLIGKEGPVTKEAICKMKYLAACVKESMRLNYPTMSGVQRYLPHDIVLQGHRIPAGTMISLMNQKIVKNEKYFPNPEAFEPERWLRDEEGKRANPIPPYALLPFGLGPRQCIGKRFAEQEIYLAIIKLIQNFKVELDPSSEEVEIIYRIFVGPRNPIHFIFKPRS